MSVVVFCWFSLLFWQSDGPVADLTPAQQRGKAIYLRGQGSGDQIMAKLGTENTMVSANLMPCVNCHGDDGQGRPEGGIYPSNIVWSELTKPYGTQQPGGRTHQPYNDRTLKRAITMGSDSSGNALNSVMPRYLLSRNDMDDLIAYIKVLGRERDPGVDDERLKLGLVLPGSPDRVAGALIGQLVQETVDKINASGGIYGRQLALDLCFLPPMREQQLTGLQTFIERSRPFALVAGHLDPPLLKWLGGKGVPVIGAVSDEPVTDFPLNRFVFYLQPGLADQAAVLVAAANKNIRGTKPSSLVLTMEGVASAKAVARLRKECSGPNWPDVKVLPLDGGDARDAQTVRQFQADGVRLVFFFGPKMDGLALLRTIDTTDWRPILLLPYTLVDKELFTLSAEIRQRIFLADYTLGPEAGTKEMAAYRAGVGRETDLMARGGLHWSAAASMILLHDALTQIGRDVTREKLIQQLERTYRFETGLTAPLTFGPNRRVGIRGSGVMAPHPTEHRFVLMEPFKEIK